MNINEYYECLFRNYFSNLPEEEEKVAQTVTDKNHIIAASALLGKLDANTDKLLLSFFSSVFAGKNCDMIDLARESLSEKIERVNPDLLIQIHPFLSGKFSESSEKIPSANDVMHAMLYFKRENATGIPEKYS